jgi:hypothetical protein
MTFRAFAWISLLAVIIALVPTTVGYAHGEPVIVVSPVVAAAGASITVTGAEMEPGGVFRLFLESASTSIELGEATAEGEGEEDGFVVTISLPSDLPAGSYTLRASTEEGETAVADLTVTAASAEADPGPAMAQEPSGEPHLLDRSMPAGEVAGAASLALASAVLGVWLIRRKEPSA